MKLNCQVYLCFRARNFRHASLSCCPKTHRPMATCRNYFASIKRFQLYGRNPTTIDMDYQPKDSIMHLMSAASPSKNLPNCRFKSHNSAHNTDRGERLTHFPSQKQQDPISRKLLSKSTLMGGKD